MPLPIELADAERSQLIKHGRVVGDPWALLREATGLEAVPDGAPVIVPLALWRARRAALIARGDVGVWLAPADDPESLADDLRVLPVVAVDFPQFTDGRGYSTARLLRERYGYRGELRAVGDVLCDQLYALAECGFDAFVIRADRDATVALAGLDDCDGVYAPTTRTPQPWFRRRQSTAPAGRATSARAERATSARAERATSARAERVTTLVALLRRIATEHRPAVLSTGFGAEGMVLIDVIATHALPIRIFTLDTGRLPEETCALIDRTRERYGLPIDVYVPDTRRLQAFVREHGVNAFYGSVERRRQCCAVRKIEPLARALVAKGAWITGLRRTQSVTRQAIAIEEYDGVHGLPKFNPLADWSDDDVWTYVRANGVPYNALHDRGYPSIGCAPCTRAVAPGEDIRLGRWWWEDGERKECGLHGRASVISLRTAAKAVDALVT